jgi:hypothetical protein
MKKSPEKILVLNKVLLKLRLRKITGDIIWYVRIPAGRMGGYTLAPAGTPDVVAIVNQRNGSIALLFIECKRPGKKTYDYEQAQFVKNMEGKPKVLCCLIDDPAQLSMYINRAVEL